MAKSLNYLLWLLALTLGCLFASRGVLLYAAEIGTVSDSNFAISEEFTGQSQGVAVDQSNETVTSEGQFVTTVTLPSTSREFSFKTTSSTTTIPALVSGELSFKTLDPPITPVGPLSVSDELTFKTLAEPVNPPPPDDNGNGGGGGGGGGSSGGRLPVAVTELLVQPRPCPLYLTKFIKFGTDNDPAEVRKLQIFLRDYEGFANLAVTGVYDQATLVAVMIFQTRYREAILKPWGIDYPTGFVYITTSLAINNLYCERDPANDLDLRIRQGQIELPPAATSTATTTLPEVGAAERSRNLWQVAVLGLLDFIRNHPWLWLLFLIVLILVIVFGPIREKRKKEEDG